MAKLTTKPIEPLIKPESIQLSPAVRQILVPRADGSMAQLAVPFRQSRHVGRPQQKPRSICAVVIHSTENAELEGMARMNAGLFASDASPLASVHYFVDDRDVYQTVREEDVACATGHQGPGGVDLVSVHVEIVGRANQTASQWSDDYSRLALYNAMGLVADVCRRCKLQPLFIPAAVLAHGDFNGITTHHEISIATRQPGGHYDPGPNFPMEAFLNGVQWVMLRLENPMPDAR